MPSRPVPRTRTTFAFRKSSNTVFVAVATSKARQSKVADRSLSPLLSATAIRRASGSTRSSSSSSVSKPAFCAPTPSDAQTRSRQNNGVLEETPGTTIVSYHREGTAGAAKWRCKISSSRTAEIIEQLLPSNSKSGHAASYPRKRAVTLHLPTVLYTTGVTLPADFVCRQGTASHQSRAHDTA